MGGRLDSTNVIEPLASVITNIGLDHQRFLGNTLPEIATEKAGIIKKGIPVVIGETQTEVLPVFVNVAAGMDTPLSIADQKWYIESTENDQELNIYHGRELFLNLVFPLRGYYQHKNLITVMEALRILKNMNLKLPLKAIKNGIENVVVNTKFQGRWQILGHEPTIICDSGHNRGGIAEVTKNLRSVNYEKLHFVFGVVNDKSLDGMLELLPRQAEYYFCKADIPRGLSANELAQKAATFGLTGNTFPSVQKAFDAARQRANTKDLIFIGGSTFVVAEVLA